MAEPVLGDSNGPANVEWEESTARAAAPGIKKRCLVNVRADMSMATSGRDSRIEEGEKTPATLGADEARFSPPK